MNPKSPKQNQPQSDQHSQVVPGGQSGPGDPGSDGEQKRQELPDEEQHSQRIDNREDPVESR
jgi:hypothetical protein